MAVSGIYKITNIVTNKLYIGSAEYVNNPWSSHKKDLRKNRHVITYLQNA